MKISKEQMLYSAKKMREILSSIEGILDGYEGIDGNKSYVSYCFKKAKLANEDDLVLGQLYDDTFNADISKRKGINIATLSRIIENYFKLLDDIDTASDIFKPTWCKITSVVSELHALRWLYCTVEDDEISGVVINGECFKKEDRIVFRNL
jgi:hypothetical protein